MADEYFEIRLEERFFHLALVKCRPDKYNYDDNDEKDVENEDGEVDSKAWTFFAPASSVV